MLCSKSESKVLFTGSKNLSQDLPDPDPCCCGAKELNQLWVCSYVYSIPKQEYVCFICIYSVPGILVIIYSALNNQLIALSIGKAHAQVPVAKSTICSVYATYL